MFKRVIPKEQIRLIFLIMFSGEFMLNCIYYISDHNEGFVCSFVVKNSLYDHAADDP